MEVAEGRGHDAPQRHSLVQSTTTKSIEEIATTILQDIRPERLMY
jgi:regulator of PEP synthase PpsR (kinase-PPPase family)